MVTARRVRIFEGWLTGAVARDVRGCTFHRGERDRRDPHLMAVFQAAAKAPVKVVADLDSGEEIVYTAIRKS